MTLKEILKVLVHVINFGEWKFMTLQTTNLRANEPRYEKTGLHGCRHKPYCTATEDG